MWVIAGPEQLLVVRWPICSSKTAKRQPIHPPARRLLLCPAGRNH